MCKELPDVQFVFAGTGPLESEIEDIPNIKNVGFQTGESLEKLIREANFSIYPSEWYHILHHGHHSKSLYRCHPEAKSSYSVQKNQS